MWPCAMCPSQPAISHGPAASHLSLAQCARKTQSLKRRVRGNERARLVQKEVAGLGDALMPRHTNGLMADRSLALALQPQHPRHTWRRAGASVKSAVLTNVPRRGLSLVAPLSLPRKRSVSNSTTGSSTPRDGPPAAAPEASRGRREVGPLGEPSAYEANSSSQQRQCRGGAVCCVLCSSSSTALQLDGKNMNKHTGCGDEGHTLFA